RRRRGGRCRDDRLRDPDIARLALSPRLPRLCPNRPAGMIAFLASVGAAFLAFLSAAGRIVRFAGEALAAALTPPYYPRLILRQVVYIGYRSEEHTSELQSRVDLVC